MPFVRDWSYVRRLIHTGQFMPHFTGAEILWVRFITDSKAVAAVLPRPLRAAAEPLAWGFVASYPETNFGVTYHEGALLVSAEYRGERGWYCLSMPVDDDTAMIGGREQFGFPKKMAKVTLDRDGAHVVGCVVRNGVQLLRIEGDFVDPQPADVHPPWGVSAVDPDGRACEKVVNFLFKYFPAVDGGPFEHSPALIRQVTLFRPRPGQLTGISKIELGSTATDPLGEVPVQRVLAAGYGAFDNTMLPGRVVHRIYNQLRFLPKSLFKFDAFALVDPDSLPRLTLRQRRQQRRRLRSY